MEQMKRIFAIISFTLFVVQLQAQPVCTKDNQPVNVLEFIKETKELRIEEKYDEIIEIIHKKIENDSSQKWYYYQLACVYALKGDTIRPFEYLYNYLDLQYLAKQIPTSNLCIIQCNGNNLQTD